jgi:hypothetical protein
MLALLPAGNRQIGRHLVPLLHPSWTQLPSLNRRRL